MPREAPSPANVQHILQRARQAVELPDHDGIALRQVIEQTMQFRTVPTATGGSLFE